ncbi:MAG: thiamine diphosphokinase [Lachnospiraceae bacterium]|nr:thiamine diphosphokinase [Lachnospiraceae bacterium]
MKGNCIIIGAGDLTVGRIDHWEGDYIIAVDGGLSYCSVLELEPDLIIGDFDSVNDQEKQAIALFEQQIPDRVIRLKPEKDDTDMLAALKIALEMGFRSFRIYGGTGGRLEHTLANIQCLLYLKNQGAQGYLCDGSSMIFVMKDEEVRFQPAMEGYLSLFSLGKEAKGVSIRGMKYPLENYTMTNDFPIGVSNEFIGEQGIITVEDGEVVGIIQYVTD